MRGKTMLPYTSNPLGREGFSRGFTLIELIIVIAILSILVTITTLSIRNMRPSLDAKQTANKMVTLLWEARSRAVSSHYQHKLDFDVPGGQFRMQSGSQAYNTPATGWAVVSGYDWESLSNGLTMRSGADCTSTNTVNVQFNANGTARLETPAGSNSPTPVSICVRSDGGSKTYRITISTAGTVILQ
jgi:prepilin-type N-terminal cleavage/methylation domain-containing protein